MESNPGWQAFSLCGSDGASCAGPFQCRPELAGRVEEMTIVAGTKLGAYEIVALVGLCRQGAKPPFPAASSLRSQAINFANVSDSLALLLG
jgi:hypothetical protein